MRPGQAWLHARTLGGRMGLPTLHWLREVRFMGHVRTIVQGAAFCNVGALVCCSVSRVASCGRRRLLQRRSYDDRPALGCLSLDAMLLGFISCDADAPARHAGCIIIMAGVSFVLLVHPCRAVLCCVKRQCADQASPMNEWEPPSGAQPSSRVRVLRHSACMQPDCTYSTPMHRRRELAGTPDWCIGPQ